MNNLETYARACCTEEYYIYNLVSRPSRVQEVAMVTFLPFFYFYFLSFLIEQIWKMTKYDSISFSGPRLSHQTVHSCVNRKYECMCCVQSSDTSAEEEKLVYSFRPQTPLLDNTSDINNHDSWSKCLPLPTPEEKMRQQAQSVTTDLVPINITGTVFQCNILETFLPVLGV